MILGTAGYLAPEQVRGDAVDARTDLFALGSILFELMTGRRAFAREHTIDTLHAIVHDDPPDLLPRGTPLTAIVTRLLAKAPDDQVPVGQPTCSGRWSRLDPTELERRPARVAPAPAISRRVRRLGDGWRRRPGDGRWRRSSAGWLRRTGAESTGRASAHPVHLVAARRHGARLGARRLA